MSRTMEKITLADIEGCTVVDLRGDEVGKVEDLYLDEASGQPSWLLVKRGRRARTFVPVRGASSDGDTIQLPFESDAVENAPDLDDDARLSPDDERRLLDHYRSVDSAARFRAGDDEDHHVSGRTFRSVDEPVEIVSIRRVRVPIEGDELGLAREELDIDRRPWRDGDDRRQPAGPDVLEIVLHRERLAEASELDDRDDRDDER